MTAPHSLLVRTDASITIGTGHVMRCLALAQAWQQARGNAIFVMAESTASIEARLRIGNIKVERLCATPGSSDDVTRTCDVARREQADWIVVDGYRFDSAYQKALRAAGMKVLFIDDNGEASPYSADLILNQNLHASEAMYRLARSPRPPASRIALHPAAPRVRLLAHPRLRDRPARSPGPGHHGRQRSRQCDRENSSPPARRARSRVNRCGRRQQPASGRTRATRRTGRSSPNSSLKRCFRHARPDGLGRSGHRRRRHYKLGNVHDGPARSPVRARAQPGKNCERVGAAWSRRQSRLRRQCFRLPHRSHLARPAGLAKQARANV